MGAKPKAAKKGTRGKVRRGRRTESPWLGADVEAIQRILDALRKKGRWIDVRRLRHVAEHIYASEARSVEETRAQVLRAVQVSRRVMRPAMKVNSRLRHLSIGAPLTAETRRRRVALALISNYSEVDAAIEVLRALGWEAEAAGRLMLEE